MPTVWVYEMLFNLCTSELQMHSYLHEYETAVYNINLHIGSVAFVHNSEWPELNITLNRRFFPPSTNQTLMSNTVFSGLVVSWFFAASPMSRSPSGVNATYEGVIRLPWSLAIISTRPFLKTPTLQVTKVQSKHTLNIQSVTALLYLYWHSVLIYVAIWLKTLLFIQFQHRTH